VERERKSKQTFKIIYATVFALLKIYHFDEEDFE
jgi:hypothetical protein